MLTRMRISPIILTALTGIWTTTMAIEPNKTVIPPAVSYQATPLPLTDVRLTGGPLKQAQDLDRSYLLKLEPDRMLSYMRERAGLDKKAEPYGGWDGSGRQLTGHIAGHYLSAVSIMYATTGDTKLKDRADYIVSQLKEIQTARKTGYIGAILGDAERRGNASGSITDGKPLEDGEKLFARIKEGRIESGGFDLNGMWAPWYVEHKIFAGLRDAYRMTGNEEALKVEIQFGQWCEDVVGDLTETQVQKMLETEFGGMSEVLVDLYVDTGDARWLKLSKQFKHRMILDPLAEGKDILPGKHGNTQIPKLIGSLTEYLYTGDVASGRAAETFWDAVVFHHSFATGGHGYDEYFGPPDKLNGQIDGTGQRSRDLRTAESCNVYNMLKMTRRLFALKPEIKYADFQERALFNHVLASINSKTGDTCYMVPVGPGVTHEYQRMFHDFTCCVGSGMESHALHADGLYYATDDKLLINIYTPSIVEWKNAGMTVTVVTEMPIGDSATLNIKTQSKKLQTLSLRRPAWAGEGFAITVNGEIVKDLRQQGDFVNITRQWIDGDQVIVKLPHSLRTEVLADNPNRAAILWGPLVLGGDFGDRRSAEKIVDFPVFETAGQPLTEWLKPVDGSPGMFTATTADHRKITLSPFYTLHDRRYGLYWDIFSPQQWAEHQAEYQAEQARLRKISQATIAFVQVGEMQPERDYNFQSEGSTIVRTDGQPGRRGGQWISFDVPLDPQSSMQINITTRSDQTADFKILLDQIDLGNSIAKHEDKTRFAELTYSIPAAGVMNKKKATIKLQASPGKTLPSIYGIRILRKTDD